MKMSPFPLAVLYRWDYVILGKDFNKFPSAFINYVICKKNNNIKILT